MRGAEKRATTTTCAAQIWRSGGVLERVLRDILSEGLRRLHIERGAGAVPFCVALGGGTAGKRVGL